MKKSFLLVAFIFSLASWCFAWQQRVAYDIDVNLDTVKHTLTGIEHLRYWNNSPDTLTYVWFHMYPNAYIGLNTNLTKDAERYQDYRAHFMEPRDKGFIRVQQLSIDDSTIPWSTIQYTTSTMPISDTLPSIMVIADTCYHAADYNYIPPEPDEIRIHLPRPLAPNDSADIRTSFTVKLPKIISRLGHEKAHYEISQWYPKIVVYDEKGWHPDGYHYNGEFYGDYGSFNVGITTPKGMKVGATGVEIIDTTNNDSTSNDSTDYHLFCAENVHDFAWCADAKYVVTEELYNGVSIKVMALPMDTVKWQHVMQYSKDALDYYGKWYGAYPYSTLTVCDGSMAAGGGMEYPNLVIISSGEDKYTRILEGVVMHEIGHQWFYGMLGNNEMDEAWLDEGINSFSEQRYMEEKYGPIANYLAKPRLQKMFPELNERYFGDIFCYLFAANRMEQPVLTKSWAAREPASYAEFAYYKPARMIWWLKNYLGDELFDRVMRAYFTKYQYHHVSTDKFLAVVDSVAHKDIRPFFMPMLTTTQRCDYAIASVKSVKQQNNMYQIRLQRLDSLVLPVSLRLEDRINKRYAVQWNGKGIDTTFYIQTDAALQRATLDPDTALPEIFRFNDHWPRQYSLTLLPRLPSFNCYQVWAVPLPWYDAINGFRLGPILHGGYMIDGGPMMGRHQWTASAYYGFKSRQLSWGLDYQTPVSELPMPPRVYGTFGKAYDTYWAGIGTRRQWGAMLMSPSERFDVHLDYGKVVTVDRFWDPRDIEQGESWIATAERGFSHRRWWLGSDLRVAAAAGLSNTPAAGMRNFTRAEIEQRVSLRLGRSLRLNIRAIAGQIAGDPPAQEQYFLSGNFKATGLDNLIISYKGWFSAQERYHIDGGANLPGYTGRHIRGNDLLAANISLPIPRSPAALFCGAGQVAGQWADFGLRRTAADAGIDLRLPFLRVLLPLWINRPEPGHKRFDWRWLISIGGSFSIG